MAIPESSLSLALQATADFLDANFDEDVVATVASPQKAHEQAKGSSKHVLNLFAYRIAPSGIHADFGAEDPFFIRANVLLTAFPAGNEGAKNDTDLRLLGQAIRVLQSFPVIPALLPGPTGVGISNNDFRFENQQLTSYHLQAIFQAPSMEELNHIWTTQGGELAYQLSAAYELALIPIEPFSYAPPAPIVKDTEFVLVPRAGVALFQMFHSDGRLFSHRDVQSTEASVRVSLTGVPQTSVALSVEWRRTAGNNERQSAQLFQIKTIDVDSDDAQFDVTLSNPSLGDKATLTVRSVTTDGLIIEGAPPSNQIHLSVIA